MIHRFNVKGFKLSIEIKILCLALKYQTLIRQCFIWKMRQVVLFETVI